LMESTDRLNANPRAPDPRCGDGHPRRLPRLGGVDFYSAYAHGYARVAAVTIPIALADPATNARTVIEQVRACHEEGVAVAVFPELCLSGYAIDDLFLQDTLLTAVERAIVDVAAATEDLRPVVV